MPPAGIRVPAVSNANSTTTALAADATFTGVFEEVLKFGTIFVTVHSDAASAADGLKFQWSTNGVDIDDEDAFTYPVLVGGFGKVYSIGVQSRFFRVVYENGTDPQSFFRMQTLFHYGSPKPSSHRITGNIVGDDDAELVKAVLTGLVDGTTDTFSNIGVSDNAGLLVDTAGRLSEVRGRTSVNEVLDASTAPETLFTVSTGQRFYLTSLTLNAINRDTSELLRILFKDGGSSGVIRVASLAAPAQAVGEVLLSQSAQAFLEPIQFGTDVFVDMLGSTDISVSVTLSGYEEPN